MNSELRVNGPWYYNISNPLLDVVEWIGTLLTLALTPFVMWLPASMRHAPPATDLMPGAHWEIWAIGIIFVICGIALSLVSKKYLLPHRYVIEYQFGDGHEEVSGLAKNGPYQLIRHPWYLANIVQTIGIACAWYPFTLLFFFIIPAVVIAVMVRILFEERFLSLNFGIEYSLYKDKTKLLIPLLL